MRVPRVTPRGLATTAVVIAVCGFVASCASGGSQNAQQTSNPTPSVATTAAPESLNPFPPAQTDGPGAPATWPAPQATQFRFIKTVVAYRKDAAPASQDLSGSVNIDGYLQAVMRSNRDIWSEAFRGVSSLQMPPLTYDVTSRSDQYVSSCLRGGEKIVVTPAYGKFFYCSSDNQPYGAIALPTGVVTPIWKKTSRPLADLTVAISTSRQASLILLGSLQKQLDLPRPSDAGRQYTANCIAGVWAHAVYTQNAFTEKDLSVALYQSLLIPSEVDGVVTSPKADDNQAITSWVVGFRGGDPSECGLHFWD